MALFIQADQLTEGKFDMQNTSFFSKMVYGSHSSLMLSTRPAGYHSKPHYHECEQINMVTDGELYFYTDKQAYRLKKGDIIRVQPNVPHWAYNKGTVPCSQVTVHAPGFQKETPDAVGLFDEGEKVLFEHEPVNIYVAPGSVDIQAIESMPAIGED